MVTLSLTSNRWGHSVTPNNSLKSSPNILKIYILVKNHVMDSLRVFFLSVRKCYPAICSKQVLSRFAVVAMSEIESTSLLMHRKNCAFCKSFNRNLNSRIIRPVTFVTDRTTLVRCKKQVRMGFSSGGPQTIVIPHPPREPQPAASTSGIKTWEGFG